MMNSKPDFEIANSQTEFSGVQGQNNWYYGYYDGPFTSSDFQQMTQFSGGWFVQYENYWTFLSSNGGHPNGVITSGGRTPVEHWAVRRWVSEVDGEIQIYGTLAKADVGGGNGIIGHIFVDGVKVWSQSIAGTDGTGVNYQIQTKVKLGSVVDFAIDPKDANDVVDSTSFTAQINALNQTPTNLTLSNLHVPTFSTPTNFTGVAHPRSIKVGDFNSDGKLDLAVANYVNNNVSVLLGTGTGSFSSATNFAVGINPASITTGDFNADGKLDLAVANVNSQNVSVLLGTGTGSFGTATNFAVGINPGSITTGDFNADGKLDLAVANVNSQNVSVLLGTGTGSFSSATNFAVGVNPQSVTVGDFNGDGKLDLAVANANPSFNNVSVLLGTGTGSFGAATNFAVGTHPSAIAVGDFNKDGKLDLVTANYYSNNISILLGTGTGSFSIANNFAVVLNPNAVTVEDFNSDGTLDLAVTNAGSDSISLLLGTGTGSFSSATNLSVVSNPISVTEGDFNRDGKLDLVTANLSSDNLSILLNLTTSSININENVAANTVIGNFSTTDPDTGDTFTYSLVTGTGSTDNAFFTITGNQLKTNAVFDFETKNSYSIRVQTKDQGGLSYEKQLTIGINNIDNNAITGTANNENFTSTNDKDIIDAGAGNDTVTSLFANLQQSDTIDGNAGTDTLVITGGTSATNLTINAGNSTNQIPSITGTTIFGFECFDLSSFIGKISFLGTTGNDWIQAGAGNDYLDPGTGNDTMIGGSGNDIYVVDSIGDVVTETSTLSTEIDTVQSSISYTLGVNVENLTLIGTENINGTGNSLNNNITGNVANNTLNGLDGDDVFFSLAGDDIINAGNGNDTVFAGLGNDTLNGDVGNDTLYGEEGNDIISGGDGNDFLVGGAGSDTIIGGSGNDIYVVDSIGDVVTETSTLATEIDTVQSSISYTLGVNVENLTLIGTENINGTGNSLNNNITGNAANNILNGLDGDDVFFSLAGDDIINAGNGNDTVFAGLGNDTLNGDVGNDTLYGEEGNDIISGGDGNDLLYGDADNDTLSGGAGGDTLTGGLGADRFVYSNVGDSLLGTPDRIIDFNPVEGDRIVVNSLPTALFNVGVLSTASYSTLNAAAIAAYEDANPNLTGSQPLTTNQAVFFGWNGGTYLSVNDGIAGFNASSDLFINVTGITGTLATGSLTPNNYFSV
ncbi:beta strand repeat-containing protein [Anabaena azotica]|uniref:VCBS repeat-containing protein n=1 Tax=Anabaena azotica FACHB-119 TaxID=947527 RepID=A0ABR8DEK0_9NOST|nr:FG-GAP-like repeat-containing protein [Anabaena azotica]MBD2505061.1 VCBS repeat-containing protein [Anabaena azotica FACHB-119]